MKILKCLVVFLFLTGCVKTASESIADASLIQVGAVEQTVKKECPTGKFDAVFDALRANIRAQLKTCETEKQQIQAEKNKWRFGFFGLLVLVGLYIARKVLK